MKFIRKGQPPQELISWTHEDSKDQDGNPIRWGYNDMPADVRAAVKNSLIAEQGGLCCYTGRRINFGTSHIEHLKPQQNCENHEDTEYRNLLAAYPSSTAKNGCAYGAHKKANWYDENLFVHPLRADCEVRYRYRFDGKIEARTNNDAGVVETIQQLDLKNKELVGMRKAAIHGALLSDPLRKKQVERLMAAMDDRDASGNFREFCFVIKQACEEYLRRNG